MEVSNVRKSLNRLHTNQPNQADILVQTSDFKYDSENSQIFENKFIETSAVSHADETIQDYQQMITADSLQDNIQFVVDDDQLLLQLTKICRCCLSARADLRSIFDNDSGIPEMIMAFAAVQISPDDSLPSQICMQCVVQVSRSLSFKQQLETADATLRHFVSQGCLDGIKLPGLENVELEEIDEQSDSKYRYIKFGTENIECGSETTIGNVDLDCVSLENQEKDIFDDSSDFLDDTSYRADEYSSHQVIDKNEEISVIENDEDVTKIEEDQSKSTMIDSSVSCKDEPETDSIRKRYSKRKAEQQIVLKNKMIKNEYGRGREQATEWTCYLCKKKFSDVRKLNRHKKIHIDDKPYRCTTCNKGFNDRTDLNRHVLRHARTSEATIVFNFNCPDCHMGFNIEKDLNIHSSVHRQDGRIVCGECSKEFSTNIQLKRHVRIHFEDKPHKCRVCNKGFPEMGSLTRHFRRHTGEQREKKHLCTTCGKKYYDSHSLGVHIRTHTGEKPWICTTCGKGFIDSRLLHSHVKVHSTEKPYACSLCDKRFTHQSTLTTHIRTHTGEKPYVCSVCGKTFIQSSNLSLHMRVHSGEKPYKCSVCERSFASSSTLTMHMRIHTGEKPYNCNICNKSFARHDLSAHMRTHTGEKPFECTSCVKRFTTSGQLNQHLRTHTGEKPFICNICHKACSSSTYLKKHKKIHCHPQQNSLSVVNPSKKKPIQFNETIATVVDNELLQQNEDVFVRLNNALSQANNKDQNASIQSLQHETLLSVNTSDLITVVNNDFNKTVTIQELSPNTSMCNGKNIYQAIDPSIIRIQQVHSGGQMTDSIMTVADLSR